MSAMADYTQIIYEKEGALAWVKLNRPRYLNAQSQVLLEEMDAAFEEAVEDEEVRVIILSGEGDHFSAGHDLGTPDEIEDRAKRNYTPDIRGIVERMSKVYVEYGLKWRDLPKATIAMIHGYCIYGGWQIASSMDLVVAAEDTKLLPGFIEYFSIPWDLGVRKTKEMLFQNSFMSAQEAQEAGFVNLVVPPDQLKAETVALAERIAETDPFLVRMSKLSINQAQDVSGFRMAVQTALSNFIVMAQSGALLSPEERAKGKRSLSTVDQAMRNLKKSEEEK